MPDSNYRVYYACHYAAIGAESTGSGIPIHGLQSISTTTSFNLEQVFELGQLDIYENIENLPNVEMTLTKVLDGYPLIYHLASQGATSKTLANRTNKKSDVIVSIFSDAKDNASGTPMTQAYSSGMYINSLSYNLPVQGNCTETVNLVGNDRIWRSENFYFDGHFDGDDEPLDAVQRRQHVVMGGDAWASVWPTNLQGVTVINGSGYNALTAGVYGAHIQDVSISTNLGRTDLFELGRRKPYYRFANFPVAVDCSINVSAGGASPGDLVQANSDTDNLTNQPIVIKLDDTTVFDLGDRNKLLSVTYSGGDSSGGVASITYNYQNFNRLDITHGEDPDGL